MQVVYTKVSFKFPKNRKQNHHFPSAKGASFFNFSLPFCLSSSFPRKKMMENDKKQERAETDPFWIQKQKHLAIPLE